MDLHRLRVVEFDTLVSEKEGEEKTLTEPEEPKQECYKTSTDDKTDETKELESDQKCLDDNTTPVESSKKSSLIKCKSKSEIFKIPSKYKSRRRELKSNLSVVDLTKVFQENAHSTQKKRTLNLFNRKSRVDQHEESIRKQQQIHDEPNFFFVRETPSFIRLSRKRAKNEESKKKRDSKLSNDIYGFQKNNPYIDPYLYRMSCNYLNIDKLPKKIRKGFRRKPKPPQPPNECLCKHHAMRVLKSGEVGPGGSGEPPAIYYNLSTHSRPRRSRRKLDGDNEGAWRRQRLINMGKDQTVAVSPSSLVSVKKNRCDANVGPSKGEVISRSHRDRDPAVQKSYRHKPYPQHSTPSPSVTSTSPVQDNPHVDASKQKKKKMPSVVHSQRKRIFAGLFHTVADFHAKYRPCGKNCVKYVFFGLLIVVWSPCLLAVILAWVVMCPVRITNLLTTTNTSKRSLPVMNSFMNRFRKKGPGSEYQRMCFENYLPVHKRSFMTSVASWYSRAVGTVVNSFNAMISMLKLKNQPPTGAGSSFLPPTHPNPKKRYTLFYADNRGWMMKPARRSNTRSCASTRVVQSMRCEFSRPKFWRKLKSDKKIQTKMGSSTECICPVHHVPGIASYQKHRSSPAGDAGPMYTSSMSGCICPDTYMSHSRNKLTGSSVYMPVTSRRLPRQQVNMPPIFFHPTSNIASSSTKYQKQKNVSSNFDSIKTSDFSQKNYAKHSLSQRKNGTLPFGVVLNCPGGTKHPNITNKETLRTHNFGLAGKTLKMSRKYTPTYKVLGLQGHSAARGSRPEPNYTEKKSLHYHRHGVTDITKSVPIKHTAPRHTHRHGRTDIIKSIPSKYKPPRLSHRHGVTEITKSISSKYTPPRQRLKLNGLRTQSTVSKCEIAINCPCGEKKFPGHMRHKCILADMSKPEVTKKTETSTQKMSDCACIAVDPPNERSVLQHTTPINVTTTSKYIDIALNCPCGSKHQKESKEQRSNIEVPSDCACAAEIQKRLRLENKTKATQRPQKVPITVTTKSKYIDIALNCPCGSKHQQVANKAPRISNKSANKNVPSDCACASKEQPKTNKMKYNKQQFKISSSNNNVALNCPCEEKRSYKYEPTKSVSTQKKAHTSDKETMRTQTIGLRKMQDEQAHPVSVDKEIRCECNIESKGKKKERSTQLVECKCNTDKQLGPTKLENSSICQEQIPRKKTADCCCWTEQPSQIAVEQPSKQQPSECACKLETNKAFECPCKYKASTPIKTVGTKPPVEYKKAVNCKCGTEKQVSPTTMKDLPIPGPSDCACNYELSNIKNKTPTEQIVSDKKAADAGSQKSPEPVAVKTPPKQQPSECACKKETISAQTAPAKKTADFGSQKCPEPIAVKKPPKQQPSECACKKEAISAHTVTPKKTADSGTQKSPEPIAVKPPPKQQPSECACKSAQTKPAKKTADFGSQVCPEPIARKKPPKQQLSECACKKETISAQTVPAKKTADFGSQKCPELIAVKKTPKQQLSECACKKETISAQTVPAKKTADFGSQKCPELIAVKKTPKQQLSECACKKETISAQTVPARKTADFGSQKCPEPIVVKTPPKQQTSECACKKETISAQTIPAKKTADFGSQKSPEPITVKKTSKQKTKQQLSETVIRKKTADSGTQKNLDPIAATQPPQRQPSEHTFKSDPSTAQTVSRKKTADYGTQKNLDPIAVTPPPKILPSQNTLKKEFSTAETVSPKKTADYGTQKNLDPIAVTPPPKIQPSQNTLKKEAGTAETVSRKKTADYGTQKNLDPIAAKQPHQQPPFECACKEVNKTCCPCKNKPSAPETSQETVGTESSVDRQKGTEKKATKKKAVKKKPKSPKETVHCCCGDDNEVKPIPAQHPSKKKDKASRKETKASACGCGKGKKIKCPCTTLGPCPLGESLAAHKMTQKNKKNKKSKKIECCCWPEQPTSVTATESQPKGPEKGPSLEKKSSGKLLKQMISNVNNPCCTCKPKLPLSTIEVNTQSELWRQFNQTNEIEGLFGSFASGLTQSALYKVTNDCCCGTEGEPNTSTQTFLPNAQSATTEELSSPQTKGTQEPSGIFSTCECSKGTPSTGEIGTTLQQSDSSDKSQSKLLEHPSRQAQRTLRQPSSHELIKKVSSQQINVPLTNQSNMADTEALTEEDPYNLKSSSTEQTNSFGIALDCTCGKAQQTSLENNKIHITEFPSNKQMQSTQTKRIDPNKISLASQHKKLSQEQPQALKLASDQQTSKSIKKSMYDETRITKSNQPIQKHLTTLGVASDCVCDSGETIAIENTNLVSDRVKFSQTPLPKQSIAIKTAPEKTNIVGTRKLSKITQIPSQTSQKQSSAFRYQQKNTSQIQSQTSNKVFHEPPSSHRPNQTAHTFQRRSVDKSLVNNSKQAKSNVNISKQVKHPLEKVYDSQQFRSPDLQKTSRKENVCSKISDTPTKMSIHCKCSAKDLIPNSKNDKKRSKVSGRTKNQQTKTAKRQSSLFPSECPCSNPDKSDSPVSCVRTECTCSDTQPSSQPPSSKTSHRSSKVSRIVMKLRSKLISGKLSQQQKISSDEPIPSYSSSSQYPWPISKTFSSRNKPIQVEKSHQNLSRLKKLNKSPHSSMPSSSNHIKCVCSTEDALSSNHDKSSNQTHKLPLANKSYLHFFRKSKTSQQPSSQYSSLSLIQCRCHCPNHKTSSQLSSNKPSRLVGKDRNSETFPSNSSELGCRCPVDNTLSSLRSKRFFHKFQAWLSHRNTTQNPPTVKHLIPNECKCKTSTPQNDELSYHCFKKLLGIQSHPSQHLPTQRHKASKFSSSLETDEGLGRHRIGQQSILTQYPPPLDLYQTTSTANQTLPVSHVPSITTLENSSQQHPTLEPHMSKRSTFFNRPQPKPLTEKTNYFSDRISHYARKNGQEKITLSQFGQTPPIIPGKCACLSEKLQLLSEKVSQHSRMSAEKVPTSDLSSQLYSSPPTSVSKQPLISDQEPRKTTLESEAQNVLPRNFSSQQPETQSRHHGSQQTSEQKRLSGPHVLPNDDSAEIPQDFTSQQPKISKQSRLPGPNAPIARKSTIVEKTPQRLQSRRPSIPPQSRHFGSQLTPASDKEGLPSEPMTPQNSSVKTDRHLVFPQPPDISNQSRHFSSQTTPTDKEELPSDPISSLPRKATIGVETTPEFSQNQTSQQSPLADEHLPSLREEVPEQDSYDNRSRQKPSTIGNQTDRISEQLPQNYPNQQETPSFDPIIPIIPGMCKCAAIQRIKEYMDAQNPNNQPPEQQKQTDIRHISFQPPNLAEKQRLKTDPIFLYRRKTSMKMQKSEFPLYLSSQQPEIIKHQRHPSFHPTPLAEKRRVPLEPTTLFPRKTSIGTEKQSKFSQHFSSQQPEIPRSTPSLHYFQSTRIIPGNSNCSAGTYENLQEVSDHFQKKAESKLKPEVLHHLPILTDISYSNPSSDNFKKSHVISRVCAGCANKNRPPRINLSNYSNNIGMGEKPLKLSQNIIIQRSEIIQNAQNPQNLQDPKNQQNLQNSQNTESQLSPKSSLPLKLLSAFKRPTEQPKISPDKISRVSRKTAPVDKPPPGLLQRYSSGHGRKGSADGGVRQQQFPQPATQLLPCPDFNRVSISYPGHTPAHKRSEKIPGPIRSEHIPAPKRSEHIPRRANYNYPPAVGATPPPNYARYPCFTNPANACGPKSCFDEFALRRAYKRRPLRYIPPKQQVPNTTMPKQKKQSKKTDAKKKADEKKKVTEKKKKAEAKKKNKNQGTGFKLTECCQCVRELVTKAEKDAWPTEVSCRPMWIHALKRRPCFWIYKWAPSLYPTFLSCYKCQKNFCEMIMYVISICFWCPLIFCIYFCCQLLCRGGQ